MQEIESITLVGAGTMGRGIAYIATLAGLHVRLFDNDASAQQAALAHIQTLLQKGQDRGKLQPSQVQDATSRLHLADTLVTACQGADLVVEAVPENLELKREVMGQLAKIVDARVILATNTSSLSVTAIAAAASHPQRVVGLHFFNPPHALKLLEVVRAEATSDATVEAAKALGHRLQRDLVLVNDFPGFATSRLGVVLGLEAMRMVQEGVASAEDIDRAMESGYKHPMGPLRLSDLVGLDVRLAIAEYLHQELGSEQFRPPPILRRMVRAGHLGKKSGRGFYSW